jgi:hypothetical protein
VKQRILCAYAEERAIEAADCEELTGVAAGDGPASEARAAGDGEARRCELDEGLNLGGLLGRALAEEAHGNRYQLVSGARHGQIWVVDR